MSVLFLCSGGPCCLYDFRMLSRLHFTIRLDTTFIASHLRVIDTPRIGEHEGVLLWRRWALRPVCCGFLPFGVLVPGLDESRYHTKCSFELELDLPGALVARRCVFLCFLCRTYLEASMPRLLLTGSLLATLVRLVLGLDAQTRFATNCYCLFTTVRVTPRPCAPHVHNDAAISCKPFATACG